MSKKLKTFIFWPKIYKTTDEWIRSFIRQLEIEWKNLANTYNNHLSDTAVVSGLDAEKPEPSGTGMLYWATDTKTLYFDAPNLGVYKWYIINTTEVE